MVVGRARTYQQPTNVHTMWRNGACLALADPGVRTDGGGGNGVVLRVPVVSVCIML